MRSEEEIREELELARNQEQAARKSHVVNGIHSGHADVARVAKEILEWVLEERDWTKLGDSVEKSGDRD